jgi:hypothetical protein
MKLERLALIAEIAGGIAVVVTLIVLITEVHDNTKALMAANRQSVAGRTQDFISTLVSNPQFLAIQADLIPSNDPNERLALNYMADLLKLVEESYLEYRDGLLDKTYWQTRANFALVNLQTARGRKLYAAMKKMGVLTPSFVEWLDREVEKRYSDATAKSEVEQ